MTLRGSQVRNGGDVLTLSAEDVAAGGSITFQYSADSLSGPAAAPPPGSPCAMAGTMSFMYSFPSPTPTPTSPRTSLRLSPEAVGFGTDFEAKSTSLSLGSRMQMFDRCSTFKPNDSKHGQRIALASEGVTCSSSCGHGENNAAKSASPCNSMTGTSSSKSPDTQKAVRPGLFAALLENISLSQMPSQGTQVFAEERDVCKDAANVSPISRTAAFRNVLHRGPSDSSDVAVEFGRTSVADTVAQSSSTGEKADNSRAGSMCTKAFLTAPNARQQSRRGVDAAMLDDEPTVSCETWNKVGVGLSNNLALDSQEQITSLELHPRGKSDVDSMQQQAQPSPDNTPTSTPAITLQEIHRAEHFDANKESADKEQYDASPSVHSRHQRRIDMAASSGAVIAADRAVAEAIQDVVAEDNVEQGDRGPKAINETKAVISSDDSCAPVETDVAGAAFAAAADVAQNLERTHVPGSEGAAVATGNGQENSPACSSSLHLSLPLTLTPQNGRTSTATPDVRVATVAKSPGLGRSRPASNDHTTCRESTDSCASSLYLALSPSQQASGVTSRRIAVLRSPACSGSCKRGAVLGGSPERTATGKTQGSGDRRSSNGDSSGSPWSLRLPESISSSPRIGGKTGSSVNERRVPSSASDGCVSAAAPVSIAGLCVGSPLSMFEASVSAMTTSTTACSVAIRPVAEPDVTTGANCEKNKVGEANCKSSASAPMTLHSERDDRNRGCIEQTEGAGKKLVDHGEVRGAGEEVEGIQTDDDWYDDGQETECEEVDHEEEGGGCVDPVQSNPSGLEEELVEPDLMGKDVPKQRTEHCAEESFDGNQARPSIDDLRVKDPVAAPGRQCAERSTRVTGMRPDTDEDETVDILNCVSEREQDAGREVHLAQRADRQDAASTRFSKRGSMNDEAHRETAEGGEDHVNDLDEAFGNRDDTSDRDECGQGAAAPTDQEGDGASGQDDEAHVTASWDGTNMVPLPKVPPAVSNPYCSATSESGTICNRDKSSKQTIRAGSTDLPGEAATLSHTDVDEMKPRPAQDGNDTAVAHDFFTQNAAAKGRTNWAAGVCGRGDAVVYEGEANGLVAEEHLICSHASDTVACGVGKIEQSSRSDRTVLDATGSAVGGTGSIGGAGTTGISISSAQNDALFTAERPSASVCGGKSVTTCGSAQNVAAATHFAKAAEACSSDGPCGVGTGASIAKPQVGEATPLVQPAPAAPSEPNASAFQPTEEGWLSSRRPILPKQPPPTDPSGDTETMSLVAADIASTAETLGVESSVGTLGSGEDRADSRGGKHALAADGRRLVADALAQKAAYAEQDGHLGVGEQDKGKKRFLEGTEVSAVSRTSAASRGAGFSSPAKPSDISDDIEETPPTSTKKKRLKARKLLNEAALLEGGDGTAGEDEDLAMLTVVSALASVEGTEAAASRKSVWNHSKVDDGGSVGDTGNTAPATRITSAGGEISAPGHEGSRNVDGRVCQPADGTTQDIAPKDETMRAEAVFAAPCVLPKFSNSPRARTVQLHPRNASVLRVSRTAESTASRSHCSKHLAAEAVEPPVGTQVLRPAYREGVRVHGNAVEQAVDESPKRGRAGEAPSEQTKAPAPMSCLSREERASRLAAWNRWDGARQKRVRALIVELQMAQRSNDKAATDALSAALVSLQNEVFKYDPARRRGGVSCSSPPLSGDNTPDPRGDFSVRPHPVPKPAEPPPPSFRASSTGPQEIVVRGDEAVAGPSEVKSTLSEKIVLSEAPSRGGAGRAVPPRKCPDAMDLEPIHSRRRHFNLSGCGSDAHPPPPAPERSSPTRTSSVDNTAGEWLGSNRKLSCAMAFPDKSISGGEKTTARFRMASRGDGRGDRPEQRAPTTDDLNDPVFRGKMKARARADKLKRAQGSIEAQAAVLETSGRAISDNWTEAGRRRICRDTKSPVQRYAGDGGWLSSRRGGWGLDDVTTAPTSSKALPRSKSVPLLEASSPCVAGRDVCPRVVSTPKLPTAKVDDPARRGPKSKRRRINVESEPDLGSTSPSPPPKKPRDGRQVRQKYSESTLPSIDENLGRTDDTVPSDGIVTTAVVACGGASKKPSAHYSGCPTSVCPRAADSKRHGEKDRHPRRLPTVRDACVPITPRTAPNGWSRRGREMLKQAGARSGAQEAPMNTSSRLCTSTASGSTGSNVFVGICVVLAGISDPCKLRELESAIVEAGGRLSEDIPPPLSQTRVSRLTPRSSTLATAKAAMSPCSASNRKAGTSRQADEDMIVVVSRPAASREAAYILAIATGTPLVHHFWVADSLAQNKALPAAPYLLPGVRETSKRRQAEAARAAAAITTQVFPSDGSNVRIGGCGGQRDSKAFLVKAMAVARASVAKVVAKPGTPLNGMSIGVAHPCSETCEEWATILKSAGALTVRQIAKPLRDGQKNLSGPYDEAERRGGGNIQRSLARTPPGVDPSAFAERIALIGGLDCVLLDFPSTWDSKIGPTPEAVAVTSDGVLLDGISLARGGRSRQELNPFKGGGRGSLKGNSETACGRNCVGSRVNVDFLGEVVATARREGVPVVSWSWAVDCVIRGTRIKWQSSPEYLTPFSELCIRGSRPVCAFLSRDGARYEVDDHVHFDDHEGTRESGVQGLLNDSSSKGGCSGIGQIVSLERAQNERVVVVLEPLQASAMTSLATSGTKLSTSSAVGMPLVAGPSMDSSVSRGRVRRARELLTTVSVVGGCVGSNRRKVDTSCLRGKVTLVTAQEFDDRRGYCGRDPDVYVRRKVLHSKLR